MSKFTHSPEYVNFFEELPAEGEAPQASEAVTEEPTISEDAPTEDKPEVETPETAEEQNIPKSRFDKVYAEAQQAKREKAELAAKMEELTKNKTEEPAEEVPQLDQDAEKAVRALLKKEGLMTKAEFESITREEQAKSQLQSDSKELTAWAEKEGYPKFDVEKVAAYAKENGIGIGGKEALRSVYQHMNMDAIITAATKRGVTEASKPTASAEKPTAGNGAKPAAPADENKTIQNRIGDVLSSLGVTG